MTSQRRETGNPSAEVPDGPFLLYDGDCPFCSFYVAKSRFETAIGRSLRLVDGREAPDLVAQLRREGCDLEQGMILVLDGRRYPGPEAMTVLEGMSAAGAGGFGRLARRFASSPERVRRVYPWLRRLRRAALLAKGKPGFGT